jgi:hypothetical protein
MPRVFELRQLQQREGEDLSHLTPVQMGRQWPDTLHHVCCNNMLKNGRLRYGGFAIACRLFILRTAFVYVYVVDALVPIHRSKWERSLIR